MKKIKPIYAWAVVGQDNEICQIGGIDKKAATPFAIFEHNQVWNEMIVKHYKLKIIKVRITQV